jgi:tRNA threonylcarbamoyladenosine modification (KEOPS) complex  Pcc1 subunit
MPSWLVQVSLESTDVTALQASLSTEIDSNLKEGKLSFNITERNPADLRAMWNTRMRGIEASESVINLLKGHNS